MEAPPPPVPPPPPPGSYDESSISSMSERPPLLHQATITQLSTVPPPAVQAPTPDQRLVEDLEHMDFGLNSPEYWEQFNKLGLSGKQSAKVSLTHAKFLDPSEHIKGISDEFDTPGKVKLEEPLQLPTVDEVTATPDSKAFLDFITNQQGADEFKDLAVTLCQLEMAHKTALQRMQRAVLNWQSEAQRFTQMADKQEQYELQESEYLRKLKKYLHKPAADPTDSSAHSKLVDKEKALMLKSQFLALTRFDMYSQLQHFNRHSHLRALKPMATLLRVHLDYTKESSQLMQESLEKRLSQLEAHVQRLEQTSVAEEKQMRNVRRSVEKSVFASNQTFQASEAAATGTGIRDVDQINSPTKPEKKQGGVSKEGFLYMLPNEANAKAGKDAGPKEFTPVWCALEKGMLTVRIPPARGGSTSLRLDPLSKEEMEMRKKQRTGTVSEPRSGFKNLLAGAKELLGGDEHLSYYPDAEEKSATKRHTENFSLLLCTIKEERQLPVRFAFSVISPQKTVLLQAENSTQMREWMDAIQAGVSDELNAQTGGGRSEQKDAEKELILAELRAIEGNDKCADCGAAGPEWASINLGIMLCLQCSGVHRNLGVHISKVRSLNLDKLDPFLLQYMKAVGNARSNAMWEQIKPDTAPSLEPNCSKEQRQAYIQQKYADRTWLEKSQEQDIDKALYVATQALDYVTMLWLCAQGANPNWHNPHEEDRTSLLQSAFFGSTLCNELLIQNGGKVDEVEERGWNVLHYAAYYNDVYTVEQVLGRGFGRLLLSKDFFEQTPVDIAIAQETEKGDTILCTDESGRSLVEVLKTAQQKELDRLKERDEVALRLAEQDKALQAGAHPHGRRLSKVPTGSRNPKPKSGGLLSKMWKGFGK